MEIHLATIRALLRPTLGYDSFAAGFISATKPDQGIPTACINAKGVLRYNPEFVNQYIRTEADLFCLVFHELLHPAFGHFIHGADELTNIACDAIINSVIANLFREESGSGRLFEVFYPERGLSAILRPRSKLSYSRYRRLYELLYPYYSSRGTRLSAGEVIQTLKTLAQGTPQPIVLLGSHAPLPGADGTKSEAVGWPDKICAEISRDILNAIRSSGTSAGYFDNLIDLIVEVLKTKSTIREDLLLGYATRKKLDSFFDEQQRPRRITSPFPLNPSRRDMVLLTAGIWPGLFRNRQPEVTLHRKGVAIYLDVSGSVNDHLPEILGVLAHYRSRIGTVYQFSNRVAEVSFDQLCSGRVHTTYGTDFNCVALSILENEYERAVVITDGIACLDESQGLDLKKNGVRLLTILFGGPESCDALEPFGEVAQLEDLAH